MTLRLGGRLHHIGVGRTYSRTRVLILIQDLNIRIIHAATGKLLRELTLDPTRDYQPTGAPKGPKRKSSEPNAGSELFRCLETSECPGPESNLRPMDYKAGQRNYSYPRRIALGANYFGRAELPAIIDQNRPNPIDSRTLVVNKWRRNHLLDNVLTFH